MKSFPVFPSQPLWDADTLASAVPVRLRLHQLFALGAAAVDAFPASANPHMPVAARWQRCQYLRGAGTSAPFRIR